MKTCDEKAWGLEITRCDDGDILLTQGYDDCGDLIAVRLHRCHLDLLAEMTGLVSEVEVARICTHLKDRLRLLAAMVEAHTRPGDPLCAAVAVLVPDAPRRHITAPAEPRQAPENAPAIESADVGTTAPVSGDLFSEIAEEVQT